MRAALWLGLLIYALVLAGLATLNGALLALALPPLVYLAAGLLARPSAPSLRVARTLSADRVSAGAPVEVRVLATNTGPAIAELLLEDRVPARLALVGGAPRAVASLAPGASIELAYTVSGPRGLYQFEEVLAHARDRLGLLTRSQPLAAPGQLFVVPEVPGLRRLAIRPRQTQIYAGSVPARQGGPGVEFFGVRAYQPGDPTRWISARVSARHAEALFVNEFEQERAVEVGIILDVRQASDIRTAQGSLLEHGVQAAAALATGMLDQGNRVGLLVYGNTLSWTFPGYGRVQRERILRALARAELGDAPVFEDFDRIPTRLFPARSQLILVSPLLPRDRDVLLRLRARGYQLLVVSPDPVAYERAALAPGNAADLGARLARLARASLLHDIRRAGVAVVEWEVTQPFQQVAAAALSRPAPPRSLL